MYTRVRDKQTKHRFDVLVESFNPAVHEKVTSGPVSGESRYVRPPQHFVGKAAKEASGEPSGDTNKEKED